MNLKRRLAVFLSIVLGAGWLMTAGAQATETIVSENHNMPVTASSHFSNLTCDNTGGASVSITGTVVARGLGATVRFRNPSGVKTKDSTILEQDVTMTVTPSQTWTINKQPSLGGVGGNPWILFEFGVTTSAGAWESAKNDAGQSVDPVVIGRCVQSRRGDYYPQINQTAIQAYFSMQSAVRGFMRSLECSKNKSVVSVDASQNGGQITGRLHLDNATHQQDAVKRQNHDATSTLDISTPIQTRKGWGAGGAGGNPLIGLAFHRDNVAPDFSNSLFVRCNRLTA